MVCFCNSISSTTLPPRLIPTPPPLLLRNFRPNGCNFQINHWKMSRRRISVVTRAGPPGATTYIFAFVFPLSLLAITIFTSMRVADKLDQKFFEEQAVDQAILEAKEDNDEIPVPPKRETEPTRSRNRPKREVES